jgi:protein-tyrosine sulfotransferase
MSEAPAPVFLGGCPRSGLTLLRALLSTHPGIYCGSDTVLAPPIVMQWKSFSTSLGQLHSTDFALDSEAVRQNMAQLLIGVLGPGDSVQIVDKSPLNVVVFADLARLLPQAKFVHVVRDGRDVAASLLERDWRHPQTGQAFDHVRDPLAALTYWARLAGAGVRAEAEIGPQRCLRVRYEDLVQRPKRTLKALFAFMELEMPRDVFEFHRRSLDLVGTERDSEALLSKPLTRNRVGRAPAPLKARAHSISQISSLLAQLGYPPSPRRITQM